MWSTRKDALGPTLGNQDAGLAAWQFDDVANFPCGKVDVVYEISELA